MEIKKASYGLWFLCIIILLSLCKCQADLTGSPKRRKGIEDASFYLLQQGNLQVNITNWGAALVSLKTPDAEGNLGDILLGYDTLAQYKNMTSRRHFGAIVGRVANRIKNAQFTLNGTTYHLFANDGNNSIHGGKIGFDNVLWQVIKLEGGSTPSIKLHYHSFDGEEGFPGDLDVFATYSITGDMELTLEIEATPTNKATPVNLINHAYWNLAGQNSDKTILDHSVKIWASDYTPTDDSKVPTGQISPLKGTPLDFSTEAIIGSRINEVPGGFDHNYVLNAPTSDNKGLRVAARAKDPKSKRVLEVSTNKPGMQFYTSNSIKPTVGKGGIIYKPYYGFCFETQAFPNAVNQPNFPTVIVNPGQVYSHTILFKFSVEK